MKKILLTGLAMLLVFCLNDNAYAVTEDYAIEYVKDNEIMTGTDVGFQAEKELTRAELTAIACRMIGVYDRDIEQFDGGAISYSDVRDNHWARKYIQAGTLYGLVKGSDGKFNPDSPVTYQEALTIAIRALGAGEYVEYFGTWPDNYIKFAYEKGILDGLKEDLTSYATRGKVAIVLANTLNSYKYDGMRQADTTLASLLKIQRKYNSNNTKDIYITASNSNSVIGNGTTVKFRVDAREHEKGLKKVTVNIMHYNENNIDYIVKKEINVSKNDYTYEYKFTNTYDSYHVSITGEDKDGNCEIVNFDYDIAG